MTAARCGIPLFASLLLACGGAGPTGGAIMAPATGVDRELVGTWIGPITGPQASGNLTMLLNGDGSMSALVDDPGFQPIDAGTWSVDGDQFEARGRDAVGTEVSFTAPRSAARLTGTWSAGSGPPRGTIDLIKQ